VFVLVCLMISSSVDVNRAPRDLFRTKGRSVEWPVALHEQQRQRLKLSGRKRRFFDWKSRREDQQYRNSRTTYALEPD
jgi:hypothetical protein